MENIKDNSLKVIKRDGREEEVSFDKVLRRMKALSENLDVNPFVIAQKTCNRIYNRIPTYELDILSSEICASMITHHPDYKKLASRITMSNIEKNTSPSFSETIQILYDNKNIKGERSSLISEELYNIVQKHKTKLNNIIKHKRDNKIDYFGLKTLEKSYLFKVNGKIIERPQYLYMRVALGIHGDNIKDVIKTYDALSEQYFSHATPTYFNAGTKRPQMSSCFLVGMKEDSIRGIYDTLGDCAEISKWAGGIGLHISNIRGKNSIINGTNGISNGVIPMLRVFNNTARYVDQCVKPETYIYTSEGPKQIQNCEIGKTQIYTLNGLENIENILEHSYSGKMMKIYNEHSIEPMEITLEHPVYCIKDNNISNNEILNQLRNGQLNPEWIEVKDLRKNDLVVFKKPEYEKDVKEISKEDCYMYGLLIQYGEMSQTSDCYISNKDKKNVEFVENYLDRLCVRNYRDRNSENTKICWKRNIILPFRYSDIYDEHNNKRINIKWLNLPLEKVSNILSGILDSNIIENNRIIYETDNRNLVECIRYLLLRMGILTSGSGVNNSYKLLIPLFNKNNLYDNLDKDYIVYNDLLLSRISDIEECSHNGILYDLQLKDTHNYMIHNGYVHNGGGKRKGSIAIYYEPWHCDVYSLLDCRKNHGSEEERARDLFFGLWVPDLFMKRIKENGDWTLMCPNECPGLSDCYGEEFEKLYEKYEKEGRGRETVKAQDLWYKVCQSQIETGTPYILYKDSCNMKSNQKNLGTIKSSNLCCEIVEYSDKNETAVCNLASLGLPKYVEKNQETGKMEFNFGKLGEVTKLITRNLNKIIDKNFYPIPETRVSNMRHRPIGIGVQGLADVFAKMKIGFDSDEACYLNKKIFEHISFNAIECSMELSKKREKVVKKYKEILSKLNSNTINEEERGVIIEEREKYESELNPIREEIDREKYLGSYSSFDGSPLSQGKFQFDLWNKEPSEEMKSRWEKLRKDIKKYGVRNSLLLAPMPTASSAQILGNNEAFEPFTSNIYVRRVLSGEFIVINEYLVRDLIDLNLWNRNMMKRILKNRGSVQDIEEIPQNIKDIYKIVWEISQKVIINMAADRGIYVCQSQSMNLFIGEPDFAKLTSMHFYSWKKGLKTGMYYLRTRPLAQAQQFTIEPENKTNTKDNIENDINEIKMCNRNDPDCLSCSS